MGLFDKFRKGLRKTRDEGMVKQINETIESHEKITDELFDELEEVLIMGDVGFPTAERVIGDLKEKIANDNITSVPQVRETLKDIVAGVVWGGSYLALRTKPSIILVIGVNGVGKTTTIGKLAMRLKSMGRSVVLGAADTFRAGAIEQLQVWADRAGVPLVKHGEGADPAAVVYDTIQSGKAKNADVIIIDTAGRLHNKKNLMDELNKISRVIDRELPNASRETLLVLDATTGQNAVNQAKDFKEAAGITGIILTKLDGTARGGVVLAINNELDVPVKFVGVGEQIDDLQPFDAEAFASAMFDIKPTHDDDNTIADFINESVKTEEEPTEEDKK
ncbi:signal recognition particle-docking protein FtsY [Eubacterium sp.]|uniref:signal recognition particle-docking protein FtsY n=1 Tax=uncultured Eubacterium sp. TaxID=165185 RepID=UPI002614B766|nr:signal recognition particle-docking protein FtsY [uncultured Eubacterium sp.]